LIRALDDRVVDYMPTDELFDDDHNGEITWDHMLRQTSDWRGTLFDMPAWADRPPRTTPDGQPATLTDIQNLPLSEPGTVYKYNDVRVNVLALAALNVWREPLPQVLRTHVMDPIGASNTWRWYGYRNSWVEIDGQMMQSVSGGGHWGGGMHISTRDMARFGYLFLNDGVWNGERIISEGWIEMARTPGTDNDGYGFMNWMLNSERQNRQGEPTRSVPQAPDAVWFAGGGANLIFFDRDSDVVIVVRWIGTGSDQFFGMVLDAIQDR
jgi:CubicO group peptidase (beta-lactamase class C family)